MDFGHPALVGTSLSHQAAQESQGQLFGIKAGAESRAGEAAAGLGQQQELAGAGGTDMAQLAPSSLQRNQGTPTSARKGN